MVLARNPLVLPLAGVCLGLLAGRFTRFDTPELIASAAALALLTVLAALRARRVLPLLTLCLAAAAGGALSEFHRPPAPPQLDAADNEVLVVSGCIVDPPTLPGDSARFSIELEPGARVRVTLTTREGERIPDLRYGQPVEIEARVRAPRAFQNPGAFDYAGYLARRNIYWTASARGVSKLTMLPGACGSRWAAFWHNVRRECLRRLTTLYVGDLYATAMMAGMLVGDESAIERSWTEAYRRTGTYHALVISGLHITLLAGAGLTILRLVPIPLGLRLILAGLIAWAYALLAGMQPPVLRAAGGFSLFILASYVNREGRILNLLAAVALAFLVTDPAQLFEASFQLSFLAVAAIGGLAAPVIDRTSATANRARRNLLRTRHEPSLPHAVAALRVELRLLVRLINLVTRLPRERAAAIVSLAVRCTAWIFNSLLVSLAVQLALLLPSVAYFHRVPITSLSANLVAVPALSSAVPFGLFAILSNWTLPAQAANHLLQLARYVVDWHSALEPDWRLPAAPFWLALAFVVALLFAAASNRRARFAWAALFALGVSIATHPFDPDTQPGRLELTAIDVGQGDSLLLVSPQSRAMLVDGGGIPSFDPRFKPRLEIGEDVVSSYLWTRGFKRLDIVAITHVHDDHAQGMLALLENFRPRELWIGAAPPIAAWNAIANKARELGVRIVPKRRGDGYDFDGVHIRALAPSIDYRPGATAKNNDSLVLQLAYGSHRFLLCGDIERQVEQELIDREPLLRADVLKVAHHGSKSSSTPEFLERVRPAFALISSGRYNSYGHPHSTVLANLASHNTRVLRTDRDGLVTVRSDGKRLELETYRDVLRPTRLLPAIGSE